MNKLFLSLLLLVSSSMYGVSVVTFTYTPAGPPDFTTPAFESAIGTTFSPAVTNGQEVAYDAFNMADVFQQVTVAGVSGTSVYKRGHANEANAAFWDLSPGQQFVYLTPDSFDEGAQWRTLRTNAGGSYTFSGWSAITAGENSISIPAGAAGDVSRQTGIQVQGVNSFTSFRHYEMGSHSIDTLSLSVVPEPSTYALLAGLAAFLYVAIKRRK